MTATPEQLSALIGDIYDAALDPGLWIGVLARTAAFCGGQAGGLLTKNSVNHLGDVHYQYGVDNHFVQLYRDLYWRFDPLAPLALFPPGIVTSIVDYSSEQEFRDGRFFKEWVEPQGWIDAANVVVESSATTMAILSVLRNNSSGPVDAEMRSRLTLLVPHFRRAVVISDLLERGRTEVAELAETIETLRAAAFLVDAEGRVVRSNAAAADLIANGNAVSVVDGRIEAVDPGANRALERAFAAAGISDAALGLEGLAVALSTVGDQRRVAHVLPLAGGARLRKGTLGSAVAVLFVVNTAAEATSADRALIDAYSLTPTEFRVLRAVVEVGGVPRAAAALGIASTTVKTHLSRVYGKTGVARQVDLARLVADFRRP